MLDFKQKQRQQPHNKTAEELPAPPSPSNLTSVDFRPPEVMELIEIPLNRFRYHFRPIYWQEQLRMKFPPKEDQRKIILAAALVDVSGLKVDSSAALSILTEIPEALLWRIWVL